MSAKGFFTVLCDSEALYLDFYCSHRDTKVWSSVQLTAQEAQRLAQALVHGAANLEARSQHEEDIAATAELFGIENAEDLWEHYFKPEVPPVTGSPHTPMNDPG